MIDPQRPNLGDRLLFESVDLLILHARRRNQSEFINVAAVPEQCS